MVELTLVNNGKLDHTFTAPDLNIEAILRAGETVEGDLVVVYPGIRPDAVAIPVGQGHSDYGRFAERRGSNPLSLVAPLLGQAPGLPLQWAATRVRVEGTGRRQELARLESLDGAGREKLR